MPRSLSRFLFVATLVAWPHAARAQRNARATPASTPSAAVSAAPAAPVIVTCASPSAVANNCPNHIGGSLIVTLMGC
jgi:hypothetical protein